MEAFATRSILLTADVLSLKSPPAKAGALALDMLRIHAPYTLKFNCITSESKIHTVDCNCYVPIPCLLNTYHHARLLNICQYLNLMKKAESWKNIKVNVICCKFTFRWIYELANIYKQWKTDLLITSWKFWLRNRWEWPIHEANENTIGGPKIELYEMNNSILKYICKKISLSIFIVVIFACFRFDSWVVWRRCFRCFL